MAAFINFYLTNVNEEIVDVGYFPASADGARMPPSRPGWTRWAATPSAVACGRVQAMTLPEVNPLEVTGDIVTAGSSTVFPLSERMAERFQDEGYAGNITIDSIGSGAGFERFCVDGRDGHLEREPGDQGLGGGVVPGDWARADRVPRGHGRAGGGGEPGERLYRRTRRWRSWR